MPVIQDQIWVAAWLAYCQGGRYLDKKLNANVFEKHGADAVQNVEGTNPGQKEASGGPIDGSTAVEDTGAQTSPPPVLTVDE
ncbi:hypothetical protein RHSIM_Rhsim13G0133400 [Rhododendron simsii]|uniref:Uncharacterized protein n=1 Tax=Rhododendron simsii TaxID=118357 RepID=A0A834G019_RHOSS|nr:hypothetical protein RHSIM_Rhsim13G0133400 [Rhododendron simsii]